MLTATLMLQPAAFADDWSQFGLSRTRSRVSAEISGPRFGSGSWTFHLPSVQDKVDLALVASPAVGDGSVVVGTSDLRIRALRERDGRPLWEASVGGAVQGSPAIDKGVVYAASLDRQIYALRLDTGDLLWKRDLGGLLYSSPVVVDGSLFVATGNPVPRVFRLDSATGRVQWTAGEGVLQQATFSSVAVATGHVLIGEMQGRLHSFSAKSGLHEWSYQTGGTVNFSSPLVVQDRVYVLPGGADPRLFAVDLATGAAVPGWPLEMALPTDLLAGKRVAQSFVVSSPVGGGDRIAFDLRREEFVDTNGDGAGDTWLLNEFAVAVDPRSARLAWIVANGRVVTQDPNQIPPYGLCPTPVIYRTARGNRLVATASTLASRIRVLDLATGAERWSAGLSGPTRGSPVMANGRLFVGTDAGVVHSFLSGTNQPPKSPTAGFFPSGGQLVDTGSIAFRWRPAFDVEADDLTYQVRFDSDGEILRSWAGEFTTSVAAVSLLENEATLLADQTYTYSVRSRDPSGAWSGWSEKQSFRTVAAPPVSIGSRTFENLGAALGAARVGDTISLGVGAYHLSGAIRMPAGVNLTGAAPHLTVIDAFGIDAGILIENSADQIHISSLTVAHATTGIKVTDAHGVELRNVIVRDNQQAGIEVGASGMARIINATVFGNGLGIQAFGPTEVRNSIVTNNDTGMSAPDPSLIISRYNNVFANLDFDLVDVPKGIGDMNHIVQFQDVDGLDLRLWPQQATTDRGDPTDPFQLEPTPAGNRINMGAFGNTPFAEFSAQQSGPDIEVSSSAVSTPRGATGAPVGATRAPVAGSPSSPEPAPVGCACSTATLPLSTRSAPFGTGGVLLFGGLLFLVTTVRRPRRRSHRRGM